MAALLTSSRYGGRPARLGIANLSQMTGLSTRTVKRALSQLLRQGILVRRGRYGWLQISLGGAEAKAGGANKLAPPATKKPSRGRANKLALPMGQQAGPSPTVFMFSFYLLIDTSNSPFTTILGGFAYL